MSHARTQIRDAVIGHLAGLTTTGSRVFASRMYPQDALPCLLVKTDDEDIAPGTIANIVERRLAVRVEGYAQADPVDTVLDQIALEVETAMATDVRFVLDAIEVDFDDSLQKPVGRIALTYRITYFMAATAPQTIIS